jgi:hypothetical protein
MTGWRSLHAQIIDNDKLPDRESISEELKSKCRHSRTSVYEGELYILVLERKSTPLLNFAKKYSEAFDTIAIGYGDDTGSGNDKVTFYDVNNLGVEPRGTHPCSL